MNRPDAAAVREWVWATLDHAERVAAPVEVVGYTLAERTWEVVWARSPALALMRRALAALEHPTPSPACLRVTVWGGADAPPPPAPPWEWGTQAARGDLGVELPDGVHLAYHGHSGGISLFDERSGRASWWTGRAPSVAPWEVAAPLRTLLAWWARTFGAELAHAAAVGLPGGAAALLVGKGGSGKSSTAVHALAAGLAYLGDDYVLVDVSELRVHLLYATAKLVDHEPVPLDPSLLLDGLDTMGVFPKRVAMLWPELREQLPTSMPLGAVVAPCVAKGVMHSQATRLPAARALAALAPSTMLQMSGLGADSLGRLAALVRAVPAFRLELGSDRAGAVAALAEVLRSVEPT